MDAETETQAGLRQEYSVLRNEILVTDRTCLLVMGVLLSGAAALASIAAESSTSFIGVIISPLWLVGYLYFSEKRFVILRISEYLKSEVEPRCVGTGWERWHQSRKEKAGQYTRIDPYYLESALSIIVITGTPFFVASLDGWNLAEVNVLSKFVILLSLALTVWIVASIFVHRYRKLTSRV